MHKAHAAGPWPAFNSLWFAKKLQGLIPHIPGALCPGSSCGFASQEHLCCCWSSIPTSPGCRDAGNAGHKGSEGKVGDEAPCIPQLPSLQPHT